MGDFHQKYVLGMKLGKGCFGQVRICYKASALNAQDKEGTRVRERAVKIVNLRESCEGERNVSRAHLQKVANKEVSVWKQVGKHPNCVYLHDFFFGDHFCYMIMEK